MQSDPRDRNSYFSADNVFRYMKEYAGAVAGAINKVSEQEIENAKDVLRLTIARSGRIFVAGNGGSAAISDHLTCDFVKGTYSEDRPGLQVQSLVGSQALFSAIGNDFGYEHTFSFQLKAANVNAHDCVILISSSGNSQNIIEAMLYAQSKKANVIGLSGFDGGGLRKLADVSLHIPFNNYGVVEDCHQMIMHVLAQFQHLSMK